MLIYFDKEEPIEGVDEFPSKYEPSKLVLSIALVTIILSNIGSYFNYDINQILDESFRIYFNVTAKKVVQLYTLYYTFSFPLTIIGGFLISFIGPSTTVVLLTFTSFLGSISSVYATVTANFFYIYLGRAADGLAAELNDIAINTVISIWFKGKFLSLAISLAQLCNSLSSSANTFLAVRIFQKTRDIGKVYIVASFICCFSSICTLIFQFLDLKRDKVNRTHKAAKENSPMFQAIEEKRRKLKETESGSRTEENDDDDEDDNHEEGEKISLDMFKKLNNKQIWSMMATAGLSDAVYFCFTFFTTGLLTKTFELSQEKAASVMTILPISAMVTAPFFGAITVKIGKKMTMLLTAYIIVIISLVGIYLLPARDNLYITIPLFMVGAFKGVSSSFIWSGIALVTPQSSVPLAFCITELSSNLLTALISYIFGEIIGDERSESYQILVLFMVLFCLFGLIVCFWTMKEDRKRGGLLELPENELKAVGMKKIIDFRGNQIGDIMKYLNFADSQLEQIEGQDNEVDDVDE